MADPQFVESKALPLFPTLVWSYQLDPTTSDAMNAQLATAIDQIISPRPALDPGRSWQTTQDLHQRPEFAELTSHIEAATVQTLDFLQIEYDGFLITGCWANVNPTGSPHTPHTHPNNYLSGVYYVRVPPGGDAISFHEPRTQLNVIAPRIRQPTNHNMSIINLPIQAGRLLMFPSWFRHSVPPNRAESERISISFNVMFPTFAETMSAPKWQGLGGDAGA